MSEPREGGLIRLIPYPEQTGLWLLPSWAVLCGAVASSRIHLVPADAVRLAMSVLLVEGGWGTVWSALWATDWTAVLQQWSRWPVPEVRSSIPYARPDAPAGRIAAGLARFHSWWRRSLLPSAGQALGQVLIGLVVSLLLAFALGPEVLLLTLATLALMELALLRGRGAEGAPVGYGGALRMGAPWLVGHLAFAPLTLPSVALAGAFSLVAVGADAGSTRARLMWIGGQLLVVGLLVALQRPLASTFIFITLVPQWLLLDARTPSGPVRRHALPWLAAAMLLAAWAM